MTYQKALRYLESFINYENIPYWPYKQSLKLCRFERFLATLANPHHGLRFIHVAGSKGKGSTCAFIAFILREAGFTVGLYTSPHLSCFRERIRILKARQSASLKRDDFEGMISRKDLARYTAGLKPYIQGIQQRSPHDPFTFFEVYTALAFVYFKAKKVDFVILETGLGGRLDATNIARAQVCAITPISYEHTDKLGETLRQIAREKAGIIKIPNTVVVSAPQEKEVLEVIRAKCKEARAKLWEVGKDIAYQRKENSFRVKGICANYPGFRIRLLGEHQYINATVATGVIEALRLQGIRVTEQAIRHGLANTVWPGRCEVLSRNPLVVLDGAQNAASSAKLKKAIQENFKYKNLILVLGICRDKDIPGICQELSGLADQVIITKAQTPRASNPQVLASYFKGKDTYLTHKVKDAKKLALQLGGKQDLILVCGSLFVVGEFRHGWH